MDDAAAYTAQPELVEFDESLDARVLFLNRQAEELRRAGEFGGAKESLFAAHKLLDDVPDSAERDTLLATTLQNLGCVHCNCREHRRAVMFLEAASRLEASQYRESAVTLLNLSSALAALGELSRAKEVAQHASTIAQLHQPAVAPLAVLQVAKVETELVFTKPRDSERTPLALAALERFHEASAAAGRDAALHPQILAELRDARSRFHNAGLLRGAAVPLTHGAGSRVPALPRVACTAKPSPRGPYASNEERRVRVTRQKGQSPKRSPGRAGARTPRGTLPPVKPSPPAPRVEPPATARPAKEHVTATLPPIQPRAPVQQPPRQAPRPHLVAPVLWTCHALYGLQALLEATSRKKRPVTALRSVYKFVREQHPLLPRFELRKKASEPRLGKDQQVQKPSTALASRRSASAVLLKAVELLRERNELPLRRQCFSKWRKVLPVFRRLRPLRRAAQHLATQSAATHRKLRWDTWFARAPREARVATLPAPRSDPSPSTAVSAHASPAEPNADKTTSQGQSTRVSTRQGTPERSPMEQLIAKWLGKITTLWHQIEDEREKFDEATVKDDIATLRSMMSDFASSLATCSEKHSEVPLSDPPAVAAQLEPFIELLGTDNEETPETCELLRALLRTVPDTVGVKQLCRNVKLPQVCIEDGLFKILAAYLDVCGDAPIGNWMQLIAEGVYDADVRVPLVETVLAYPTAFPVGKLARELQSHWEHLLNDLTSKPFDGRDRELALVDKLLRAPGVVVDLNKEGVDDCDFINRAAAAGDVSFLKVLLDAAPNVSVDSRVSSGLTPLSHAVLANSLEAVQFLLDRGASTRLQYNGMTPLEVARKLGADADIVQVLETATTQAEDSVALAARKSFRSSPAAEDDGDADDGEHPVGMSGSAEVDAFDDEELGLSDEDAEVMALSGDGGDTELQLRNEAIETFAADAPPFDTLEIAPADAPRRRVMRDADGGLYVADRVSTAEAACTINHDRTVGYVTMTIGGKAVSAADCGGEGDEPLRLELITLDNGHVAFVAADHDGKLLEPDLAEERSAMALVADEDASSFSEFITTTVERGEQDQTFLEAMRIANRRESETAKERRRKERKRNARLEIIRKFFTDAFADKSFVLGPVDAENLRITYDSLSVPTVQATDEDSPLSQHVVVEADEDAFVTVRIREARHLVLAGVDGEVSFLPEAEFRWEVIELADGNMALEAVDVQQLLEIRLDTTPHGIVLVPEEESSSFCELVVRAECLLDDALPDAANATEPANAETSSPLSEDEAARRIQALHRGRMVRKRMATRNEAEPEHGPGAGSATALSEDDAAVRIQSLQRRRAAAKRVDGLRKERDDAAAVKIQALARRRQAAREAAARRARSNASDAPPQLASLLGMALLAAAPRRLRTLKALYTAQCLSDSERRKTSGRRKLGDAEAATKIQALRRGHVARKRADEARAARVTPTERGSQDEAWTAGYSLLTGTLQLHGHHHDAITDHSRPPAKVTPREPAVTWSEPYPLLHAALALQCADRAKDATPTAHPTQDDEPDQKVRAAAATKIQALQRGRMARQDAADSNSDKVVLRQDDDKYWADGFPLLQATLLLATENSDPCNAQPAPSTRSWAAPYPLLAATLAMHAQSPESCAARDIQRLVRGHLGRKAARGRRDQLENAFSERESAEADPGDV